MSVWLVVAVLWPITSLVVALLGGMMMTSGRHPETGPADLTVEPTAVGLPAASG